MKFGERRDERSWRELEGDGSSRYDEDRFYTCIKFSKTNLKFKRCD